MSQPVPPPSGNPFAGGDQFAPAPPPAPVRDRVGLGIVAAVVAALVAAGAYGAIGGAIEREIGYAAVGVGFLVGFAAAKVGGRNPALPVISAVLSIGAVYLGQLIVTAVMVTKFGGASFTEVFFGHFGDLMTLWKRDAEGMTYVFLGIAAITAFAGAKKADA
ncbi:hypothetical protein [Streptomyces sp. NPDC002889]|uniref:hypothetical protein n=1 Tax=Streptomyces sp. NPDC002889 TaxID=3364669 RepID=UPI003697AD84